MKLSEQIRQMNDDALAEYLATVIRSCINGELSGIIAVCEKQIERNQAEGLNELIAAIKESLEKEADSDGSN